MSTPNVGMTFTRAEGGAVPVLGADFSKVWIIETSEDADAAKFPLNTPVRFSTSDIAYTSKLGTGNLADAIAGINSQLNSLNAGADVVVTRVTEEATVAATVANIVAALGTAATLPSIVNATPRLIWAGRTEWRLDTETASPIVAALPEVCGRFLAIAVVDVDDTSSALAIDARETMNSERLMAVGIAAKVFEGEALVTRAMGPRVIGLFIRVDNEHHGNPFHPIGNRPLYGLAGLSRDLQFSFLDGSTEGQQMLEADVAIVDLGETGVDGAVADGGAVFIGFDNTTTGELWKQIHQVRAADYLTVKFIEATRNFLGKKISADVVEAWLNTLKFIIRDHTAAGDILGGEVNFLPDSNSVEQIRLGTLTVDIGVEAASAFKLAHHDLHRYRPAVEGLVSEIVARLSDAA